MSTFKRLFNVGVGKAKVARKGVSEAVTGVEAPATGGDWVDSARNAAADAAESVAEVLRPPERQAAPVDAPRARTAPRAAGSAHTQGSPVDPVVEDAEEIAENIESAAKSPKKRTL